MIEGEQMVGRNGMVDGIETTAKLGECLTHEKTVAVKSHKDLHVLPIEWYRGEDP
jgi:hypothetical protein